MLLKDIKDALKKLSAKDETDLGEAAKNAIKLFRENGFEVRVFRHKWKLAKRLDLSKEKYSMLIAGMAELQPVVSLIIEALPKSKHLIFKLHKKGA